MIVEMNYMYSFENGRVFDAYEGGFLTQIACIQAGQKCFAAEGKE